VLIVTIVRQGNLIWDALTEIPVSVLVVYNTRTVRMGPFYMDALVLMQERVLHVQINLRDTFMSTMVGFWIYANTKNVRSVLLVPTERIVTGRTVENVRIVFVLTVTYHKTVEV
jgi:hypothetical protein